MSQQDRGHRQAGGWLNNLGKMSNERQRHNDCKNNGERIARELEERHWRERRTALQNKAQERVIKVTEQRRARDHNRDYE